MAQLVKAILKCQDNAPDIIFMFNPKELVFERVVQIADNPGSRDSNTGVPKVSFSHTKPYQVTINNILFDTYESGLNVVTIFIDPFRKAVEFAQGKESPPIYKFIWGDQIYLRSCFIERLNYKLTMFLSDGTPVRAVIDSLILKETEHSKPSKSLGYDGMKNQVSDTLSQVRREIDSLDNRKKTRNNRKLPIGINPDRNRINNYF
ncbi:MAG: hypothetical protein QNJ64_09080 [Crocosphaera sp.]|nr:hypothetical protein [Crocosphaera sp.]